MVNFVVWQWVVVGVCYLYFVVWIYWVILGVDNLFWVIVEVGVIYQFFCYVEYLLQLIVDFCWNVCGECC